MTTEQQKLIDEYDPERWLQFEWDGDYYSKNGVLSLEKESPSGSARPFLPYPNYNSEKWQETWQGEHVACEGPRGKRLNESDDDIVKGYHLPAGSFPPVSVGDANVTGIDLSVCFDRYHRYGPYGYRQKHSEAVYDWKRPQVSPEWTKVDWGRLQNQCLKENQNRYRKGARDDTNLKATKSQDYFESSAKKASAPAYHSRTAILIRTWEGYKYQENDLEALRALITETSLRSGGEYQVFLFVNVKDPNADFIGDPAVHDRILKDNVPEELRNISILWNERTMEKWYPLVGDWQVYWSQFMSLQWFSKTRPEFDYVWNWEMDIRYTGNHYQFLEGVAEFALQYPRKYMWERNTRYYFPFSFGSYKNWLADTDRAIEKGIREGTTTPVWGPKPYDTKRQKPIGPKPPTSIEEDNFSWGVGEEADLVTLLPIWDPVNTLWDYREKIWNFVPGKVPHFSPEDGADINYHHPEHVNVPRRVYINTVSRFSKRLLHAMHLENKAGRNMQAEMWPATVALHHGLKAVYSPHPIWMDRKWPRWYAEGVFNADGGKPAHWSLEKDSAYAHDRERNYKTFSWYYISDFAQPLYRRWLGLITLEDSPLKAITPQAFEEQGVLFERSANTAEAARKQESAYQQLGGKGRMCLPGMLLHPVKDTKDED